MQDAMHIVISVRDFKAIVTHAETLGGSISAYFSLPTRPLQFTYQSFGVHCEFTLTTTGDLRGASSTPNRKFISTRSSSQQASVAPPQPSRTSSEMPPPARPSFNKPLSSQSQRASLKAQVHQPSVTESDPDPESLFMPGGDEDQTWDPPNYDHDEAEEMLGWDASNDNPSASFHPTFRDSGSAAPPPQQKREAAYGSEEGLEPTQRLSQVCPQIAQLSVAKLIVTATWYVRLSAQAHGLSALLSIIRGHNEARSAPSIHRSHRTGHFDLVPAALDIAVGIGRLAAIAMFTPTPG